MARLAVRCAKLHPALIQFGSLGGAQNISVRKLTGSNLLRLCTTTGFAFRCLVAVGHDLTKNPANTFWQPENRPIIAIGNGWLLRFARQAVIKGLQWLGLWAFFFIPCMAPSQSPRFPRRGKSSRSVIMRGIAALIALNLPVRDYRI